MYLIAGLGNPGAKYENTRHNIGFMVIDALAGKHRISVTERKHKALIGRGIIGDERVILVKPQTFMNLSGESLREIIDYYKIEEKEELIVISDDISLDVGALRIRKKGSAGGHNGLKNIILHLGHDEFQRVRIGVGRKPSNYDLADYVLGHFSKEDGPLIAESIKQAAEAVEVMIMENADKAMNQFNKKGTGKQQ
ncbi:MAG: aminoacyl-tRNA hydrolase [Blautia sp.]|nr:aminoacyl-tRNA hydrolase [Blautia sp.]MCM1202388.1 aminoacyl-tRNA hydrolase [Bacteroides fragilis]